MVFLFLLINDFQIGSFIMKTIKKLLISTLMFGLLSMPAIVFSQDEETQPDSEVNVEESAETDAVEQNEESTEETAEPQVVEQKEETVKAAAPIVEKKAAAPIVEKKAAKVALNAQTIKNIQLALIKNGARIKADGILGKRTAKALRTFQKKNGLKSSGKPDQKTLEKLGVS
jgi:hypothetical protein